MNKNQPHLEKSKCCGYGVNVVIDSSPLGGTSYYKCSYCGKPCDTTPQDPPVNSREDTEPRGEECDCVCGDCKGRKHFNYKDVKCINYQSPLADTVGGEEHWQSCPQDMGGDCICPPPSKQSEEIKDYMGVKGLTIKTDPSLKENEMRIEMKSTPPKAEGVGEWDDLTVDTVNLKKMIATTIEILSHKDAAEQVWSDVCKALTSATRVAEERKDGEIMSAIRFIEFSLFKWDEKSMPLNREVVGNVLTSLQNKLHDLLPPPPDKPTQP